MLALRRLAVISILGLCAAAGATPVLADHCGATGIIEPTSGPPGTTFLFTSNLGATGDLTLYKDGVRVRALVLETNTYRIRTTSGDAGVWRVRVEAQENPVCTSEATFTVVGAPDTATVPMGSSPTPPWSLAWVMGVAAFVLALAQSGRASRPGRVVPRV